MENRRYVIRPAIQQHHVAANYDVGAVRRRWRQLPFKLHGNRLDSLLQPGRKRAALYKLPFESRRQSVLLGKSRRKGVSVVVVPSSHSVAVMVAICVGGRIIVVT